MRIDVQQRIRFLVVAGVGRLGNVLQHQPANEAVQFLAEKVFCGAVFHFLRGPGVNFRLGAVAEADGKVVRGLQPAVHRRDGEGMNAPPLFPQIVAGQRQAGARDRDSGP